MLSSSVYGHAVHDEAARLQALQNADLLDTAPERNFDEAARLAATICGTPVALVNLLDKDRQWFKARIGMPLAEMPRAHSFCNHVVGRHDSLVVADASMDARFRNNPFVTGDTNIRFYAGMPLNTTEGLTVGTLCVVDTVPHDLTTDQREALEALGRQVSAQIELRAKLKLLRAVIQQKESIERELRERTVLFSAFMDHSPTIGFVKDGEGRFIYYNKMFCERFAVTPTEWIGKSTFDLFPREFAAAYHALDMAVLDTGIAQIVEETSPGPNNTILYWRTHKFRIADSTERGLLGGLSLDISSEYEAASSLRSSHAQLESANQQLMELSTTDGLTGLRNRRAFDERLAVETGTARTFSLILLDIDHFKTLNDTFGHPAGDEVLRMLASLLRSAFRDSDFVARIGGEEFAVLMSDPAPQRAFRVAERLRKLVEGYAWPLRPLTVSIGLATRCARLNEAVKLIGAADEALYRAKHSGRNRVEVAGT